MTPHLLEPALCFLRLLCGVCQLRFAFSPLLKQLPGSLLRLLDLHMPAALVRDSSSKPMLGFPPQDHRCLAT